MNGIYHLRLTVGTLLLSTLFGTLADTCVYAVPAEEEKQIDLRIQADGKVLANGVPANLPVFLKRRQQDGTSRRDITVRIRSDPKVTYGQMNEVVLICQEQGIEKFVLQSDRPYPLNMPTLAPVDAEVVELPTLKLRLSAKPDGTLAFILLNRKRLRSLDNLRTELIRIKGKISGPKSLSEKLELEIDADEELHVTHVIQAYSTAAVYEGPRGKLVPLIKNIRVFRADGKHTIDAVEKLSVPRTLDPGFR
jgi:biopolymer transport protein ExbD